VGDPWFVLSEALAYQINKTSEWLRATVVATPGITGDYELTMDNPEEYILIGECSNFVYMPQDPYGKAYNYYDKTRFISNAASQTTTWITYDKNIKTGQDLAGKKVNIGRPASARAIEEKAILEAWGVLDKVTLVGSGFGGAVGSLKDGLVDACNMLVDHVYPGGFSKGAFITDLETKGPIYYISVAPELIDGIREKGAASMPLRVPPGALDPNTQPTELWCYSMPVYWAADERMDEDIVYEVTRVIWETAGKWATWHPQGGHMTEDWIPAMPMDFKYVHPGAQKYYDEHGIKLKDIGALLR